MKEGFLKSTHNDGPKKGFQELSETYWYDVVNRINEKFAGEKPSAMQIRASVILELAGIPSGQYSALKTESTKNDEAKRSDPLGDKIIAENITNNAGLFIEGTKGITSRDLRDRYPNGLPKDVSDHLDEKTQKIIDVMYEYEKRLGVDFEKNPINPIDLHFLPGGAPVVSVGYIHNKRWQETYGRYMKDIGKEANVVALEGYKNMPLGMSLHYRWREKGNDYDALMNDLIMEGYNGIFTEVDARDQSIAAFDSEPDAFGRLRFPKLPDIFYEKYLDYIKRENPELGKHLETTERLKQFLMAQSGSDEGKFRGDRARSSRLNKNGKNYGPGAYLSDTGEVALAPTGNEFGQVMFTDALAAIKLHLLGKMMSDGYLPMGPIVDYEGAAHLSSKSFFLQYPEYAMEVVLRTIPELLSQEVRFDSWDERGIEEYSKKVFDRTDWEKVIQKIFKIPMEKMVDGENRIPNIEVGGLKKALESVRPTDHGYKVNDPLPENDDENWLLNKTLSSQEEGRKELKDWVNEMEVLIQKFK